MSALSGMDDVQAALAVLTAMPAARVSEVAIRR
jgi:hypothetical protein